MDIKKDSKTPPFLGSAFCLHTAATLQAPSFLFSLLRLHLVQLLLGTPTNVPWDTEENTANTPTIWFLSLNKVSTID